MKSPLGLIAGILFISSQVLFGQQAVNNLSKWSFLTGEWVGEGNGQPGKGEGKFTFSADLDGNIIVRKNHTFFPATATSREVTHEDLLIVYLSGKDGAQEAIYFDNEGHTIKYSVTISDTSIILTSNIIPGEPRFRFTYTKLDEKTVNSTFELASPQAPDSFRMYLSGKSFKVK
jgi:hypothetical protein